MALFDDILLTVDHDRTLTGPDSKIPQRNLEAIQYFTENGGSFTLNTGRSTTTMKPLLSRIPVNAPMVLYNGSAAWQDGRFCSYEPIPGKRIRSTMRWRSVWTRCGRHFRL